MVNPYEYDETEPLSSRELRSLGINSDNAYVDEENWEERTCRYGR